MRWAPRFIFWTELLRLTLALTKGRRWQHTETVARRVLISPACLIGLIERTGALFAFAVGGGSIITITCANPEMYEAVAPEFFVTSFPCIRRSNRGDLLKRLS